MTEQITKERGQTHGNFADNAQISQDFKCLIEDWIGRTEVLLTDIQLEALDMICLKLSRILSHGHQNADNWLDISGYATLAKQEIEGKLVPWSLRQHPVAPDDILTETSGPPEIYVDDEAWNAYMQDHVADDEEVLASGVCDEKTSKRVYKLIGKLDKAKAKQQAIEDKLRAIAADVVTC